MQRPGANRKTKLRKEDSRLRLTDLEESFQSWQHVRGIKKNRIDHLLSDDSNSDNQRPESRVMRGKKNYEHIWNLETNSRPDELHLQLTKQMRPLQSGNRNILIFVFVVIILHSPKFTDYFDDLSMANDAFDMPKIRRV